MLNGKPLCIELFCGTFGWSAGWLEMGGTVIGYDIEHLPHHGPVPKGASLVIQDVLTVHGSQFKDADLLLCSPPCTEFSYMAMPWSRAKQIAAALRGQGDFPEGYKGSRTVAELTALFDACFRIQREASEAAGHHIPLVVENVCGAIPWVGRSRAHFGSFHLWGDVPALMPIVPRDTPSRTAGAVGLRPQPGVSVAQKTVQMDALVARQGGTMKARRIHFGLEVRAIKRQIMSGWGRVDRETKNDGGSWFAIGSPEQKVTGRNPVHAMVEGFKGSEGYDRDHPQAFGWKNPKTGPGSTARKAASAQIAKIPTVLARHVAAYYFPHEQESTA